MEQVTGRSGRAMERENLEVERRELMKISTAMIDKAIRERYQEPNWLLGFEVGNSTGAELKRHADAIAMNQYPSRAFETIGIEVKISKGDLRRELEDADKCDEMYKYVNEWYLVVPKGLANGELIPPNWGIMEYYETTGRLRIKKPAEWHDAVVDKGFMIAFIRGLGRADEYTKQQTYKDAYNEVQYQEAKAQKELAALQASLEKVRKATGIDLTEWNADRYIKILEVAATISDQLKLGYKSRLNIQDQIEASIELITEAAEKIESAYKGILPLLGGENEVK